MSISWRTDTQIVAYDTMKYNSEGKKGTALSTSYITNLKLITMSEIS